MHIIKVLLIVNVNEHKYIFNFSKNNNNNATVGEFKIHVIDIFNTNFLFVMH